MVEKYDHNLSFKVTGGSRDPICPFQVFYTPNPFIKFIGLATTLLMNISCTRLGGLALRL